VRPAGVHGELDVAAGGVDGVHFGLELAQELALGFGGFAFGHVGLAPGDQGGAGGGDFGGGQAAQGVGFAEVDDVGGVLAEEAAVAPEVFLVDAVGGAFGFVLEFGFGALLDVAQGLDEHLLRGDGVGGDGQMRFPGSDDLPGQGARVGVERDEVGDGGGVYLLLAGQPGGMVGVLRGGGDVFAELDVGEELFVEFAVGLRCFGRGWRSWCWIGHNF